LPGRALQVPELEDIHASGQGDMCGRGLRTGPFHPESASHHSRTLAMRQARSGRWGVLGPGVQGFERKRNVPVSSNTGASTIAMGPMYKCANRMVFWLLVVFYRGTSSEASTARSSAQLLTAKSDICSCFASFFCCTMKVSVDACDDNILAPLMNKVPVPACARRIFKRCPSVMPVWRCTRAEITQVKPGAGFRRRGRLRHTGQGRAK
jgi:hypothetical protein